MRRRVTITESDYRKVTEWETDGGAVVDLNYNIIPDRLPNHNPPVVGNPMKRIRRDNISKKMPQPKTKAA
jgi:hypothetical protein